MKTRQAERGPETWYSICSIHREHKANCPRCEIGGWINDKDRDDELCLFQNDYIAWFKMKNGEDAYPSPETIKEMQFHFGVKIKT